MGKKSAVLFRALEKGRSKTPAKLRQRTSRIAGKKRENFRDEDISHGCRERELRVAWRKEIEILFLFFFVQKAACTWLSTFRRMNQFPVSG